MTAVLVHCGEPGGLRDIVFALQLGWGSMEILHASCPSRAVQLLAASRPEIVVVDISDGCLDRVKELRRHSPQSVIVAVSSHYEESDLIGAVEAGCDDYMQIPVSPATFVARVRAALRRTAGPPAQEPGGVARCGNLEIDPARYEVRVAGRSVRLTAKEFDLLLYLARRNGQVARHEALSRLIWGEDGELYEPWVRKYIHNLRQKLAEVPHAGVAIVTVPRVGYKLVVAGEGPRRLGASQIA